MLSCSILTCISVRKDRDWLGQMPLFFLTGDALNNELLFFMCMNSQCKM
jgi:hypothetical protein